VGRSPTPDDLIVPARAEGQRTLDGQPDHAALLSAVPDITRAELARRLGVSRAAVTQGLKRPTRRRSHGSFRTPSQAYSRLRDDLARLKLRQRRVHDTRRTMITLALNDGARRDVLQGITHGSKGEIIDLYNSPLWKLKCEELAKLQIKLRQPESPKFGTVDGEAEELRGVTKLRRQDSNPRVRQRRSLGATLACIAFVFDSLGFERFAYTLSFRLEPPFSVPIRFSVALWRH
jgi:hypothetical protein